MCLAAYLKNRDYLKSDNQLDSLRLARIQLPVQQSDFAGRLRRGAFRHDVPGALGMGHGPKISVGAPFFNHVNIPIGMMLLFLTGVGPLLAWRKTSLDSLRRISDGRCGGLVAGAIAWRWAARILRLAVRDSFGLRDAHNSLGVLSRRESDLRAHGDKHLSSAAQLTMRNTRRYGGYVVHFGIVLVFIGISGQAFNQDKQMEMTAGSQMKIGPYTLVLQTFDSTPGPITPPSASPSKSIKTARSVMMLYPKRRFYPPNQESGTMVAIYSTLREDLYVVYAGPNPDTNQPGDSRLSESAGEMDLVRRSGRGARHDSRADAESAGGHGAFDATAGASAPVLGGAQPAQVPIPRDRNCRMVMTNRRRLALICAACFGIASALGSAARGRAADRSRQGARHEVDVHVRLRSGSGAVQSHQLPVFRPMLKELDAHIANGEADDLVVQDFVQEYGEQVLTAPPTKGFNRIAWYIPASRSRSGLGIVITLIRCGGSGTWRASRRHRARRLFRTSRLPTFAMSRDAREASRSRDGGLKIMLSYPHLGDLPDTVIFRPPSSSLWRWSFLFSRIEPDPGIPRRTARSSISFSTAATRSTIICAT